MGEIDDTVTRLLREVARGEVSVEDARQALLDVELSEEQYETAIDHGVFNDVEPGTVVRSSLRPGGASLLITAVYVWGLFWVVYWAGWLVYGLMNEWDQQRLAYHLGITLVTLMILGIVYLRWVLPDLVVVKYRRAKYIPAKDPEDWVEYKW